MIYDILILGAGWTSTFLIPLLKDEKKKYAATSTTGRDSTIRFSYDPSKSDDQFKILPSSTTVLITFPLIGHGQSKQLMEGYLSTHTDVKAPKFIQLGSTGIWQSIDQTDLWITRHSPYDRKNGRAIAEDELKQLGGVVLNLSGLWGGSRQPRDFVDRIFKDKESVETKGSLHMIHGRDVARGIVAVMHDWPGASRWMLTDGTSERASIIKIGLVVLTRLGFVYDWWALLAGWGSSAKQDGTKDSAPTRVEGNESAAEEVMDDNRKDARGDVVKWVWECMEEADVKALPRSMESLGRCYDSREFFRTFKIEPVRARI